MEDLWAAALWVQAARVASPTVPFFLLGESLGALQVLEAGLACQKMQQQFGGARQFAGVVTLGALLEPAPGVFPAPLWRPALSLLSRTCCCSRMRMPGTNLSFVDDDETMYDASSSDHKSDNGNHKISAYNYTAP